MGNQLITLNGKFNFFNNIETLVNMVPRIWRAPSVYDVRSAANLLSWRGRKGGGGVSCFMFPSLLLAVQSKISKPPAWIHSVNIK